MVVVSVVSPSLEQVGTTVVDKTKALLMASSTPTEAFRVIFDANHADIEAYCRRRAPEAMANDAVSETFLVAWRRLADVPAPPNTRLWLFGVARGVLGNLRRTETRQGHLHLRLVDEPTVSAASVDPSTEVVGDPSPVLDALATLSQDDQDVLTLVTWEGLSHAEAAHVLDCSANAVGIRLHRARQRLADALTKD